MKGRSKQRNRAVAEVFSQMGLIEGWGLGLGNIRKAAKVYGLPEPEFIEMTGTFRVNLFRNSSLLAETQSIYNGIRGSEEVQKFGGDGGEFGGDGGELGGDEKIEMVASERIILQLLKENGSLTAKKLSEATGMSKRTIERIIQQLKEQRRIVRIGSARNGHWEIIE